MRTYRSAQTWYFNFCSAVSISPFPVNEHHVCQFVATLAAERVLHSSIKGYLSALCHLQISRLGEDPNLCNMAILGYVLQSILTRRRHRENPPAGHRAHHASVEALLGSIGRLRRQVNALGRGLCLFLRISAVQGGHRAVCLRLRPDRPPLHVGCLRRFQLLPVEGNAADKGVQDGSFPKVMEPLEHWQATFRADGPSFESSASRTSSGCSSMMMQWQASRSESTLFGSSTTAVRKSRAHVFSAC